MSGFPVARLESNRLQGYQLLWPSHYTSTPDFEEISVDKKRDKINYGLLVAKVNIVT